MAMGWVCSLENRRRWDYNRSRISEQNWLRIELSYQSYVVDFTGYFFFFRFCFSLLLPIFTATSVYLLRQEAVSRPNKSGKIKVFLTLGFQMGHDNTEHFCDATVLNEYVNQFNIT